MAVQGVVQDSAPSKHSVRVEWFRRDPGGTIFVKPTEDGIPLGTAVAGSTPQETLEADTTR